MLSEFTVAHCIELQIWDELHRTILLTFAREYLQRWLNVAKVQYKLRVAFSLNLPWYGSME